MSAQAELPFDASDSKMVEERIKDSKRGDELRKETLIAFMSTEDGRAFFFDLIANKTRVYTNPFSTDAVTMAFRCGELNIGQQILAAIEGASPDLYLLMCKEAKK